MNRTNITQGDIPIHTKIKNEVDNDSLSKQDPKSFADQVTESQGNITKPQSSQNTESNGQLPEDYYDKLETDLKSSL